MCEQRPLVTQPSDRLPSTVIEVTLPNMSITQVEDLLALLEDLISGIWDAHGCVLAGHFAQHFREEPESDNGDAWVDCDIPF
jgi:hypothetical protein